MPTAEPTSSPLSIEELFQQNVALRRELDEAKADRERMGEMLVDMSRRLQVSSASIKAAVSSLLDRGILWDNANQHEFLKTIEASIDQADRLIALLVNVSQAEAGSLRLQVEPQVLQEILSFVQDRSQPGSRKLAMRVIVPAEGKPVLVDFQYLMTALGLLFEVFQTGKHPQSINVRATELSETWWLDFEGLDPSVISLIQQASIIKRSRQIPSDRLRLDSALRLYVVRHLLGQQNIQIEVLAGQTIAPILRMTVPAVAVDDTSLPESDMPRSA
jgi:K+-sensing histidine kinase KdpD